MPSRGAPLISAYPFGGCTSAGRWGAKIWRDLPLQLSKYFTTMSCSVKYAFLFGNKSFSALSGLIRSWIIATCLQMNYSRTWVTLGRKGVLSPADRSHKKRQLNFMVWKLGQRSLHCPEHLSFRSLGKKKTTDFWCGRSLRQTKKEISLTFGRARLFSVFFKFRYLIKIQTREIHLIIYESFILGFLR